MLTSLKKSKTFLAKCNLTNLLNYSTFLSYQVLMSDDKTSKVKVYLNMIGKFEQKNLEKRLFIKGKRGPDAAQ